MKMETTSFCLIFKSIPPQTYDISYNGNSEDSEEKSYERNKNQIFLRVDKTEDYNSDYQSNRE